jgi:hypothetical protein
MMKLSVAFGIRPGLTQTEFRTRYEDGHSAKVNSVRTFNIYMRKYIQNYVFDTACEFPRRSPPLRGCSEIWFDSMQTFQTAYQLPDYQLLRVDEQRFVDFDNLVISFATEAPIFLREKTPQIKVLRFIHRAPTVSLEAFSEFWQQTYAQAVGSSREVRSHATAYIQNRSVVGDENPFPTSEVVSGVDEYWLDSRDSLAALISAEKAARAELGEDQYVDSGRSHYIVTEPRLVPGFEGL